MADFVIVGGGVYGCGVAWELARAGADVLVLEAQAVASGASGGPGQRNVRANGRDLRELPLMRMAYELWPALQEEIGGPTGYERNGHLLLMEREKDYAAAPAMAWAQNAHGIPTRLVERDELRTMESGLSDRVIAALHCPNDGVADHTATTQALASAARRAGAQICEETAAAALERRGERVTAVLTGQGERIPVGKAVLLASNSQAIPFVHEQMGQTLPAWSFYPQMLLAGPFAARPVRHVIGHAHRTLSIKSLPDGHLAISGGWLGRLNPQTGKGETEADQVEGNLAEAVAVFPGLAGMPLALAAADRPETITIDQIPIIGPLPGADNLILATGWSGHGWAMAPAVSRLLADWLLTGARSDLLKPFGCERFSG
jgi:sarcosine oxidase subunit beta